MLGTCGECGGIIIWVECPTGGWWAHKNHPDDNHGAKGPDVDESMDAHGDIVTNYYKAIIKK